MITVNGRTSKPAYEINLGDKIVCELPRLIQPHVVATDIPLEIVHEDDHLIAINKPPQFVVHPAAGHWDDTLVNALLHHCGVLPETDEIYKPGIVHRIDKDTSGVIIAAKTLEGPRRADEAVPGPRRPEVLPRDRGRRGAVRRGHHRQGHGPPQEGLREDGGGEEGDGQERDQLLPRDRAVQRLHVRGGGAQDGAAPTRSASTWPRSATPASPTRVREARRLFLRDLGATEDPLVPEPDQPILMRQALHAFRISFTHPATGMIVEYTAPVAKDMELVLELLRKYRPRLEPKGSKPAKKK
jgi:23S rRNA pseudouridine1911/1915/1917 synthase